MSQVEKIEGDICYKCKKSIPRNKLQEALLGGDNVKKLVCNDCLTKMARKWEDWLS